MFQPGNKLSHGRPKLALTKPELLMPAVFHKSGINWQRDFIRLYRRMKEGSFNEEEKQLYSFFKEFMPYLCTKVQLKEIADQAATNSAQSAANAAQTSKLLQALEAESSGPVTPK
jgi:uncharacterized protein YqeY